MTSQQPAPSPVSGGAPPSSVANRYGGPKRTVTKRMRNLAIVSALVLAVVAAGLMAMWNTTSFSSKDISFEIPSASTALATVEVRKDARDAVSCSIHALNESYAIVGWKTVSFEPTEGSGQQSIIRQYSLRTESLAVTAGISTCWKTN